MHVIHSESIRLRLTEAEFINLIIPGKAFGAYHLEVGTEPHIAAAALHPAQMALPPATKTTQFCRVIGSLFPATFGQLALEHESLA